MDKPKLQSSSFIVSQTQMDLDIKMTPFDIWGSKAHVLMLEKQGIVDKTKAKKIIKAFLEIETECANGNFAIDPQKGAQLTLEAKLLEKIGDLAYSVHTGRSRNDQIMVTELLYLREELLNFCQILIKLIEALYLLSQNNTQTIMPGYTHMQPGKITTLGQWSLSYLNGFLRSLETIRHYYELYDMCPLGACESYGTSWNLDREFTAKLLGFSKVWEMPQDAISSRGFAQLSFLTALSDVNLWASKIGEDLILFNTYEYGMVELGDEVAQRMHPITGSSVMAQKKNPDVLELLRATVPQVIGFWGISANILRSLPMGYNRDSREIKEFMSLGFEKSFSVVSILQKVLSTMKVNKKKMREIASTNYSLTTDLADYISQKNNLPYRLVYKVIGQIVAEAIEKNIPLDRISSNDIKMSGKQLGLEIKISDQEIKDAINPEKVIEKRKHIGGSSTKSMEISLNHARSNIKLAKNWVRGKETVITKSKDYTQDQIDKLLH